MIYDENINPTFQHPDNWNELTDLDKAYLLVKVIFLKLLAVVDFCDFEFKEASSLFREIEDFLMLTGTIVFCHSISRSAEIFTCKDVPAPNIRNIILGFSDGSLQFSTSCIYLLSYDCTGNNYSINLVSTLSKLAYKTKSAKIMSQEDLERLEKCWQYDTVPKLEAHGLVLACNGALLL